MDKATEVDTLKAVKNVNEMITKFENFITSLDKLKSELLTCLKKELLGSLAIIENLLHN